MIKKVSFLSPALLSLFLLAAASNAADYQINIWDNFFDPQTITINAGDTVTWQNYGNFIHTATSGTNCNSDGKFNSGNLSKNQAYTVQFNEAGTYTYFCIPHCMAGMTGTITVNPSTLPLPSSQQSFSYAPISSAVLNPDPSQAKPIGVGDIATGGVNLELAVSTTTFSGPADVYFAIAAPAIDSDIYLLDKNYVLQKLSAAGLVPWKEDVTVVNEQLFGKINVTTSGLPKTTYYLYLAVTPANSFGTYYLWTTYFIVQ
ncbi:MAG: plastocyanin/azurin family copper-binding protein [Nitrospirota bacterium]